MSFPAGSPPSCPINTTWACGRAMGQGRVDLTQEPRWAPWRKQPLEWAPGCDWSQPDAPGHSWLRELRPELYPASSSDLVCGLRQGQTLSGPQLAVGEVEVQTHAPRVQLDNRYQRVSRPEQDRPLFQLGENVSSLHTFKGMAVPFFGALGERDPAGQRGTL